MIRRLGKILAVFVSHRLDRALPSQHLPLWLRAMLWPIKLLPTPKEPVAVSARLALEALGPIFVKFGQLLSTRPDLFDENTWAELKKLQDQVPPFPSEEAINLIQESLGDDFA
ncbi:MAG: ubiquinone biosynthesis regulatory protein kinase UbiB, partial [Pseudomonadales bacterium]